MFSLKLKETKLMYLLLLPVTMLYITFVYATIVTAEPNDLVITEIMYNTASSEVNNHYEWIEIYNKGETSIDLTGFVLDDNNGSVLSIPNISSGSVKPDEFAILYNSEIIDTHFADIWQNSLLNLIPVTSWSALSNNGDSIGLWQNIDTYATRTFTTAIDSVDYGISSPWPADDGYGSIFLADITTDNSKPENWLLSADGMIGVITNTNGDIGSPGNASTIIAEQSLLEVSNTSPKIGQTNVPTYTDIVVQFTKLVTATIDAIVVECENSGRHLASSVITSNAEITFDITNDFAQSELCIATINQAEVIDAENMTLLSSYVFSFTTASLSLPPSDIIISEIMYDSILSNGWEWIEVYNTTAIPVDMTGYVIDDINNIAHRSANITGTVQGLSSAILYDTDSITNTAIFTSEWGAVTLIPVTGWGAMGLGNNGDQIALWNNFSSYENDHTTHSNAIDIVNYGDDTFPDTSDASIYLLDLNKDNNNGMNWSISQNGVDEAYTSTSGDVASPTSAGMLPSPTAITLSKTDTLSSANFLLIFILFIMCLLITLVSTKLKPFFDGMR